MDLNKFELYRQCLPRNVKDTEIKDLKKCECASYVMTIVPVLNIEREQMGTLVIILKIDYGVYVCICTIYTSILKQFTQQAFIYEIHFQQKRRVHAVVQSLIIDHMHPSVYWRENIEKENIH